MNPLQAALTGLGWEDLRAQYGLTQKAAWAVVRVAEERRQALRGRKVQ